MGTIGAASSTKVFFAWHGGIKLKPGQRQDFSIVKTKVEPIEKTLKDSLLKCLFVRALISFKSNR